MTFLELQTRIRAWVKDPIENYYDTDNLKEWINSATFEATKDINYPWQEQTLHGVEEQADYDYASDFIALHPLLNVYFNKKKLDKYTIGWLEQNYPDFLSADGIDQSTHFYTRYEDKVSLYPPPKLQAEGTATAGSATTTLIDSSATFISDYVGYSIRNVTDGSNGLITAVTSTTELTASLSGGSADVWANADTYKINRSGTIPYVYKETAMTLDAHTTLISTNYPNLILYRVMMDNVETKREGTEYAQERWQNRYDREVLKVKSMISKRIRGHGARTKSADTRSGSGS